MLQKITFIFGSLLFLVGLAGFFVPNFLYLVQFDLFQSLLYAILGVVGLKMALTNQTPKHRLGYLQVVAITNLLLMMLGMFWPNWGDIIHLEVIENFFHSGLGLIAVVASDIFRKKLSTQ